MSYSIFWKIALISKSVVLEWCLTKNLSHLSIIFLYKKHHRVRGILVDALPHSKYIKIIDKSTAKTIFESMCATYEGNQQVKEAKANLLVQQY